MAGLFTEHDCPPLYRRPRAVAKFSTLVIDRVDPRMCNAVDKLRMLEAIGYSAGNRSRDSSKTP